MILLHLVYNSRSGAKPDHSVSGDLSMIVNDTAGFFGQKHVMNIYKTWFRISHGFTWGRIKGWLLLFLTTFRDLSAAHTESISAPI